MASVPEYRYKGLNGPNEIRLVTILPGNFDDPIELHIKHEQLVSPDKKGHLGRPSLKEIRQTLPEDWKVHETYEGRVIFRGPSESSWTHPVPGQDGYEYSHFKPPQTSTLGYEALSYTWGPEESEDVFIRSFEDHRAGTSASPQPCPGTSTSRIATNATGQSPAASDKQPAMQRLSVRENLSEALRYLRYPDKPRTMWIDAICINQNDIAERNKQVPRMGNIYRLAHRVVAWLGIEIPGCDLAFSKLEYIGKQVELTRDDCRIPSPGCQEPTWYLDSVPIYFEDSVWDAIVEVLSRPWFERAWILQEIQLASIDSVIKCGVHEVPWPLFRRAVHCLEDKDEGTPQRFRDLSYQIFRTCDYSSATFETILRFHHSRLCHDKRDKIYAFTSLAPPYVLDSLTVDYAQDEIEVYKQAFLVCTQKTQRLVLLHFCGIPNDRSANKGPTWVPNWSKPRLSGNPNNLGFCASSISASRHTFVPPGKLEVHGVICATVSEVDVPNCQTLEQILDYLRLKGPQHLEQIAYPSGGSLLDAYLQVLSVGFLNERMPHFACPTISDLKSALKSPPTEDSIESITSWWKDFVLHWVKQTSVIMTQEGYVGICSVNNVQPGDQVVVLLGCSVPMVLRPIVGSTYQVVGDCHLHGIMDGEALLGPLSEDYTLKGQSLQNDAIEGVPGYINKNTGTEQAEDPRLARTPLPLEWEPIEMDRSRDDPVHCSKFRNKATGEVINSDPRLFPEALEAGGVPIISMTLV